MKRRLNVFNTVRRAGACRKVALRFKNITPQEALRKTYGERGGYYLRWFVRNVVDPRGQRLIATYPTRRPDGGWEDERQFRARMRGYVREWAAKRGVRV